MRKIISYIVLILLYNIFVTSESSAQLENFTVLISNNPSAGYLMIAPYAYSSISLIDNSGIAVHQASLNVTRGEIQNFTKWQNGLATFWNKDIFGGIMAFYAINDKYEVVDTFSVSPAYQTDFHDFQWLSNGHYLMLGEDWRTIDMSLIVPNGCPTARVKFNVIQEFDSNHNLVWEWNSFNHIPITDATSDNDLTASTVNYCHSNSVFLDTDGNIILSSRHLDEVTKISRATGEIIWRMGGSRCRNNQFVFTNDTHINFTGFSHQHNVQRLPNGHLLMFDNGNLRNDMSSRAVEYEVNEDAKTVTKVWEYRHNPAIYSDVQGSVQRLPNGNTLIGWSSNSMNIVCSEINPAGNTVFEMSLGGSASYRVYRQVFKMAAVTKNISTLSDYNFNDYNNNTHINLSVSELSGSGDVQLEAHSYPAHSQLFGSTAPGYVFPARWVLTNSTINRISGKIYFDFDAISNFQTPDLLNVYYRAKEGTGSFDRLPTTYNSVTKKLESTFNGFGEFIIGMPALDPPLQDAPSNNSSDLKIPLKIKWNKLNNALSYRLQLSKSPVFATMVLDSSGIKDTSLVVAGDYLTDYTKYFWRINAEKNDQTTAWSNSWVFTTELPPPFLTSPLDSAINLPVKGNLSWDKVSMADSYNLQVSENKDFSKSIINTNTKNSDYDFKDLKFNKFYYWRVSSKNGSYVSRWSDYRCFFTRLDTVKLVLPNNNFKDLNPKSAFFSWNSLVGAETYHIQISRDSNFIMLDRDIGAIKDTFFIDDKLSFDELYFWRVAGSGKIVSGEWSFVRKVITAIGPPTLVQPKNKSKNLTVSGLLNWDKTLSALSYQIQLSTDSLFKSLLEDHDKYTETTFQYQNLTNDTKYFWRVSVNTIYGKSNWSEVWSFRTRQEFYIEPPVLKTPLTEQYNLPLTGLLTWQPATGAVSYRVQLSLDNNFDYPVLDNDGLTLTEMEYGLLNYNKQYFWRVMINGLKSKSDWSETGAFFTKLESPSLILPPDQSINVKVNSAFTWNPIDGAMVYLVQFAKNVDFSQSADKTVTINIITKIEWLIGFTQYFWRVKGIGGKKESDWSDVRSFTTDDLSGVEELNIIDKNYGLFPNPFNEKLTITMALQQQTKLQISVFNSDGELKCTAIEQKVGSGSYQIYLQTIGWGDGVYFIKIKSGDDVRLIKAVKAGS